MIEHLLDLGSWAVRQRDNIVAGVIASVLVLLLQTLSRALALVLAATITLKWRLKLLWGLRHPKRVYVVSGSIEGVTQEVQSIVLAGPDADAANLLIATLGLLYPEAEIRHAYASKFPQEFYNPHSAVRRARS